MSGVLKRLGVTFSMLSCAVVLSSCAAMAGKSTYQTKLPRVAGVQQIDCQLKNEKGEVEDSKCVVLKASDMAAILTEYVKACVALGNKPQDCGVAVKK